MPLNPDSQPNSIYSKAMQQYPSPPTTYHKNKWRDICHWGHTYFMHEMQSGHQHCLKEGHYILSLHFQYDTMHMPILHHIVICGFEKEGNWLYCKHLYYVFKNLCKMNYNNDISIHAPTYTYNKVMCLLKLAMLLSMSGYWCFVLICVFEKVNIL